MSADRLQGCWTALITPFTEEGELDMEGLQKNVIFQMEQGAKLVATGTTGESPTLEWDEHDRVIEEVTNLAKGRTSVMAGTGSNSTKEALRGTRHAAEVGTDAVLLVDCYYNGPSSLELRTQYYECIAKELPHILITPYVIPGRTGTQLEVEDLAILHKKYPNVRAVKEATGDLERMAKTRALLGDDFDILSGDDDMTFDMMARNDIKAQGVVSVVSNVVPGALAEMVSCLNQGDTARARELCQALTPLFKIVTVKTMEEYEGFTVPCKFRNPSAIKTLMKGLGLPAGPLRPPLGPMTSKAKAIVQNAIQNLFENNQEILLPLQQFYNIDLEERIFDDDYWR